MTLKETILQEIELLESIHRPGFNKESFLDFIDQLENIEYVDLIADNDSESLLMKMIYEVAKSYGRSKWDEALEAARNQMCEDCSAPPQFIP